MSNSQLFSKQFCDQAVSFIELFGINWHGIDNLGEASNFIHSFTGITGRFEKMDFAAIVQSFKEVDVIDGLDCEMDLTSTNRDCVLSFLQEAVEIKDRFLNLSKEPNFVENLKQVKKQSAQLNYLNARAIIYHNCLA